jgi:HEPN domain-containing protein
MNKINVDRIITYWLKSSHHDFLTMNGLFRIKRYSDSLFFAHIVIEKVLKGLVVKNTKEQPRYIHNLVALAEDAKLELDEIGWNLLAEINRFNIRARYPDEKLKFYKLCTRKYTEDYILKIKRLYNKLCKILKEKN